MTKLTLNDQQILEGLRNGDRSVQTAVYNAWFSRAFSFLVWGGASRELAEELAQDAMVTLFQKAETLESKHNGGLFKYYCQICRYSFCKSVRQAGSFSDFEEKYYQFTGETYPVSALPADEQEEKAAEENHWQYLLQKLMTNLLSVKDELLSSKCREHIELRFWKNMEHKDIAPLLGFAAGSARELFSRCMKKLEALARQCAGNDPELSAYFK
jgi:RNA polymerase sigma factor (sigma-70 family)